MKPFTESLLREIAAHDEKGWGEGMCLDDTAARRDALKLGLIAGRKMKIGHRKIYYLTGAGRKAL